MFVCRSCGYGSPVKLGKCPQCQEFGSFVEQIGSGSKNSPARLLSTPDFVYEPVIWNVNDIELQRIFRSGIRSDGLYLLGGEPGVGKSTFVLQLIEDLLKTNQQIRPVYVTGEESVHQVAERKKRISPESLQYPIFHSCVLEDILLTLDHARYDFVILDSIQTIYSNAVSASPGSPAQVKTCAEKISEYAKSKGVCFFIVGHITKNGELAGPKYLEHIVDVVMTIEGDRTGEFRLIKISKNRFGSSQDTALVHMSEKGLVGASQQWNHRLLGDQKARGVGQVVTIGLDNGRPLMVILEVLLTKTYGKYPERNVVGLDPKRVQLVCAILEKYCSLKLGMYDIYVHIPGEFKFSDSGLDLALAVALWSSYHDRSIDTPKVYVGELGLTGQVQPSKLHDKRKKETPQGYDFFDHTVCHHIRLLGEFLS